MKNFIFWFIAGVIALTASCVSSDKESPDKSPAAGAVIYEIGDTGPGGGIVFYVTDGGEHGLEAATENAGAGTRWNNGYSTITAASAVITGYGAPNTGTIIAAQGAVETSYAAGLAASYNGGGFTDWFLPSREELNLMYLNLKCAVTELGNFGNYYYWSSSEFDAGTAWYQSFGTGVISNENKASEIRVRPVREF